MRRIENDFIAEYLYQGQKKGKIISYFVTTLFRNIIAGLYKNWRRKIYLGDCNKKGSLGGQKAYIRRIRK